MKRSNNSEIALQLATTGFAVGESLTTEEFYRTCAELGVVTQKLEVRLKEGIKQYANLPDEVPFHTDHPTVPVVAWHCIRQDESDGAMFLLDTREAVEAVSERTRQLLTTVWMRMIHREELHKLLGLNPYHMYWLPVIVKETKAVATHAQVDAIEEMYAEFDAMRRLGRFHTVRLRSGESLYLNNHIMLHARDSIAADSKRYLVRAYVE